MLRLLQAGLPMARWQPTNSTVRSAWSLCFPQAGRRMSIGACNHDNGWSAEGSPSLDYHTAGPATQVINAPALSWSSSASMPCRTTNTYGALHSQVQPSLSLSSMRSLSSTAAAKPALLLHACSSLAIPSAGLSLCTQQITHEAPRRRLSPYRADCTIATWQHSQSAAHGIDKAKFTRPNGRPLPPEVMAFLPHLLELLKEIGMTQDEADAAIRSCLKQIPKRGLAGLTEQNWLKWVNYLNLHTSSAAVVFRKQPFVLLSVLDTANADCVLRNIAERLDTLPADVSIILTKCPATIIQPAASVAAVLDYMLYSLEWHQQDVLRLASSAPSILTRASGSLQKVVNWVLSKGFEPRDIYYFALRGKIFAASVKRRLEPMFQYITHALAEDIKSKPQLEESIRRCFKSDARLLTADASSERIKSRATYWHEHLRHHYRDRPGSLALVLKYNLLKRTGPRFALLRTLGIPPPTSIVSVLYSRDATFVETVDSALYSSKPLSPHRRSAQPGGPIKILQTALAHEDYKHVVQSLMEQPQYKEIKEALSAKILDPEQAMAVFIRVWQASEEGRKYTELASRHIAATNARYGGCELPHKNR